MTDILNWRELPAFPEPLPEEQDDDRNPRKKLHRVLRPEIVDGSVSLDDGIRMIWDAINDYLKMPDPGHILLIAAPPGSRKTSIGTELSELTALDEKRVFYLGPRHEHYNDVKKMQDYPDLWQEWFPKQLANELENKHETCRYADRQAQWVGKGWNSRTYCESACHRVYMGATCVWHGQTRTAAQKQKDKGGYIVYGQHQHIFTKFPLAFDLMIVDECPKSAVERTWKIPWQKIVTKGLPDDSPFRQVLITLRDMVQTNKLINIRGAPLMAALGGWRHVLDSMDVLLPLPESLAPDNIDDPNADYAHIWDVQRILRDEASAAVSGQEYVARIALEDGDLVLTMRKNVDDKLPGHIICLDATGQENLYREIFGRPVEVVAPMIEVQGEITQVWTNTWSKSSLFDFDEKGKKAKVDHWMKGKLIIDEIASRYKTVGFISYKDDYLELAPSNAIEMGYFGGERGTNRFVPVDALIVFGNPNPPKGRIEAEATSLFSKRMKPFKLPDGTLPWKKKRISYRHVAEDGFGRAIDTLGYWDDPDLQVILEQAREAELYQSIHRLRPLIQNKPVFLVTNIPTKEYVVRVISVAELFGSPLMTDPYIWGRVKAFARLRHDQEGATIRTSDLVDTLKIHRETVGKLIDGLIHEGHWRLPTQQEKVATRKKGPGHPETIIFPC